MTAPDDGRDAEFLRTAVKKGLIAADQAKTVLTRVQRGEGQADDLLIRDGLLTRHVADTILDAARRAKEPKTIGGYRIEGRLGQGGMGTVYLAVQESIGRRVALKVVAKQLLSDKEVGERFLREGRAAGKVNHPNVITVHDVGRDQGRLYMALEFVNGGDLGRLLKKRGGRLPLRRALTIIRDACRGLGAIFRAGLLHRDIKPANIFLTSDGQAKLADLGLARSEEGDDRMTLTGATVGTPTYMSPEQANGAADLDIRSDIYALGATLYTLVCGEPPFSGPTPFSVVAQVIGDPPPDPRQKNPEIGDGVAALILTAMAKNPAERYQTPDEMIAALDECLLDPDGTPVPAPGPVHLPLPSDPRQRLIIGAGIAGAVLVLVLIGYAVMAAVGGGDGSEPSDPPESDGEQVAPGPGPSDGDGAEPGEGEDDVPSEAGELALREPSPGEPREPDPREPPPPEPPPPPLGPAGPVAYAGGIAVSDLERTCKLLDRSVLGTFFRNSALLDRSRIRLSAFMDFYGHLVGVPLTELPRGSGRFAIRLLADRRFTRADPGEPVMEVELDSPGHADAVWNALANLTNADVADRELRHDDSVFRRDVDHLHSLHNVRGTVPEAPPFHVPDHADGLHAFLDPVAMREIEGDPLSEEDRELAERLHLEAFVSFHGDGSREELHLPRLPHGFPRMDPLVLANLPGPALVKGVVAVDGDLAIDLFESLHALGAVPDPEGYDRRARADGLPDLKACLQDWRGTAAFAISPAPEPPGQPSKQLPQLSCCLPRHPGTDRHILRLLGLDDAAVASLERKPVPIPHDGDGPWRFHALARSGYLLVSTDRKFLSHAARTPLPKRFHPFLSRNRHEDGAELARDFRRELVAMLRDSRGDEDLGAFVMADNDALLDLGLRLLDIARRDPATDRRLRLVLGILRSDLTAISGSLERTRIEIRGSPEHGLHLHADNMSRWLLLPVLGGLVERAVAAEKTVHDPTSR